MSASWKVHFPFSSSGGVVEARPVDAARLHRGDRARTRLHVHAERRIRHVASPAQRTRDARKHELIRCGGARASRHDLRRHTELARPPGHGLRRIELAFLKRAPLQRNVRERRGATVEIGKRKPQNRPGGRIGHGPGDARRLVREPDARHSGDFAADGGEGAGRGERTQRRLGSDPHAEIVDEQLAGALELHGEGTREVVRTERKHDLTPLPPGGSRSCATAIPHLRIQLQLFGLDHPILIRDDLHVPGACAPATQ